MEVWIVAKYELNLAHLYGNLLNTYGDNGNLLTLNYYAKKMGIEIHSEIVSIYQEFDPDKYDFVFIGGGQDYEQVIVSKDIQDKKEYLLGIGIQKYTGLFMSTANSSYKVFIMQYGLLGIGLLILFFLSLLRMYYSNLSFGLFLLLSLSFIQRPYALWEIESFAFICAISLFLKK